MTTQVAESRVVEDNPLLSRKEDDNYGEPRKPTLILCKSTKVEHEMSRDQVIERVPF